MKRLINFLDIFLTLIILPILIILFIIRICIYKILISKKNIKGDFILYLSHYTIKTRINNGTLEELLERHFDFFKRVYAFHFPSSCNKVYRFKKGKLICVELFSILKFLKRKFRFLYYNINMFYYLDRTFYIIRHLPKSTILAANGTLLEGPAGLIIGRLNGNKVIVFDRAAYDYIYRQPEWLGRLKKMSIWIEIIVAKFCDAVLTPQESRKEYFVNNGVVKNKVYVFKKQISLDKRSIDNSDLNKNEIPNYIKNKMPYILYYGRLEKEKLVGDIILAYSKLDVQIKKIYKLIIIGYGSQLSNLKKITEQLELNDNIFFLGRMSHKELVPYIFYSEFLVLPTGGKVIIESGILNKAIITYDNNCWDYNLIKDNFSGYQAKFRNISSLSEKMAEAVFKKEKLNKLGYQLEKLILSNHNKKAVFENFQIIFNKIINGNKKKNEY